MRTGFSKFNFLLFICLFAYSCADNNSEYADLHLTKDNDGQTVEIRIDNEIAIELESNPSTGYHWIHSNTDGSFIYQEGESIFTEDPACSGFDGCGGRETLTFRSSQAGSGEIGLIYTRSAQEEPEEYFTIYVNVH